MTTYDSPIAEAARLWVIRVQDSTFDDWDGLTAWLEQDSTHNAAYDAALEDDAWVEELFRHEPPAAPAEPIPFLRSEPQPRPRRWYAMGGAIAAAVVAVVSFAVIDRSGTSEIVTAPGEHRTVPLADGSRIIMNGNTRIVIDPDMPREVELAAGEALFEVKHDATHPFVVSVGATRLLDAGTVFNVISDGSSLDVAVAEGAVIYEPGAAEIRLAAGDALSRKGAKADPTLHKASPQAIGGWQRGQLEYSGAPLDLVARDLSRNLGQTILPANGAERLRFTGTLIVDGNAGEVLERAGPLLGVDFTAEGTAWRMTPANGASPN